MERRTRGGSGLTQDPEDRRSDPIQVKFSLPQLTGGALAAATAALIGSQLGVAGTIFGAAVASVVGGVAGTLYSAGLDRTHRRVTEAIRRGYDRVLDADEADTQVLPAVDATAPMHPIDPAAAEAATEATVVDLQPVPAASAPTGGRRRKILVAMGISVAATFVVAMLVITAIELGLGRSLDGSATTTIGGARRPTPTATVTHTPAPSASSTPSASTPTSATPSAEPTPSASETPSASPSPSESVTESPTPSATQS